jgi:Ser/Thr protein kinase RdoA (MazF antagonist)
MELFQPNNLSRERPKFRTVEDIELHASIASLLSAQYGLTKLDKLNVEAFVGANVSSSNFKVSSTSTAWFLKSRDIAQQQSMMHEANLNLSLFKVGQRVPDIIRANNGSIVSVDRGKCWVLYRFQEGNYFTGKGNELDSAAKCFAGLSRAANELPEFKDQVVTFGEFAFLSTLEELLDEDLLANHNDVSLRQLCLQNREKIIDTLNRVRDANLDHSSDSLPMHLDYHPLNLLVKHDDVICILDLEHLKNYPVVAGVGFAGYKLIRQAMVDEGFRSEELRSHTAVKRWLEAWRSSFPESRLTVVELGLGARFRILKVIHLILDATLKRNDHRFNYDMAKQIGSLFEVDAIFDS